MIMALIEYNANGTRIQPGTSLYGNPGTLLIGAVIVSFIGIRWFMPTFVAFARRHPQRWNIFGLNLFIGLHSWGWTALMARAWEVI